MKDKESNAVVITMLITVIATNIALLQSMISDSLQYLPIVSFVLLSLVLALSRRIRYISNYCARLIGIVGLFLGLLLVFGLFSANDYLNANLTRPLVMCLYIFFVGYYSAIGIKQRQMAAIVYSFVISVAAVSFLVFYEYYFRGFNWSYRYSEYKYRGQLSQAIFFAMSALVFYIRPKKNSIRFCKAFLIVFFGVFLLMMKCRTALVEFSVSVFIYLGSRDSDKKVRRVILGLGILGAVLIMLNSKLYNIVINDVFLYGRSDEGLDSISSGRLTILSTFPELIEGAELFGIGNYYFECFPLNSVLQYGFIAGILPIVFAIKPCIYSLMRFIDDQNLMSYFKAISVGCIVGSLFEAIAPVGPGVKFYWLWLLYGIVVRKSEDDFADMEVYEK